MYLTSINFYKIWRAEIYGGKPDYLSGFSTRTAQAVFFDPRTQRARIDIQ